MELSAVGELQVLLEVVSLPNEHPTLLAYARAEGARAEQIALLGQLPDRRYDNIDEVAEELVRVQPAREHEVPHRPRAESGAPPGGDAHTQPHPESGSVRA